VDTPEKLAYLYNMPLFAILGRGYVVC